MTQGAPPPRDRATVARRRLVVTGLVAAGVVVTGSLVWRWLGEPAPAPPPSVVPSVPPSAVVSAPAPSAEVPRFAPDPEWTEADDTVEPTLEAQREALFRKLARFRGATAEQITAMRAIVATERWFGQGNPEVTEHPMTRAECRAIRAAAPALAAEQRGLCGARHMVPVYDPTRGETAADATVCIDQFEFPNIPCEYPTTWVRAQVAQRLCAVEGKRLCDAHEWEGACAGAVLPAQEEYAWGLRRGEEMDQRRVALQYDHNQKREIRWAYGFEKDHARCATGSRKSDGCVAPSWERCGTNTYPAGAFPACVSPFGVYDLHGNAAEHMNLPMEERERAHFGEPLGQTEMKGSWFIFGRYEAHLDDCRWRAPSWHGGAVLAPTSHMNYHLGFRCCRDLVSPPPAIAAGATAMTARDAVGPAPSVQAGAAPASPATVVPSSAPSR